MNKQGDDARPSTLSIIHLPGFDAGGTPVLEPPKTNDIKGAYYYKSMFRRANNDFEDAAIRLYFGRSTNPVEKVFPKGLMDFRYAELHDFLRWI